MLAADLEKRNCIQIFRVPMKTETILLEDQSLLLIESSRPLRARDWRCPIFKQIFTGFFLSYRHLPFLLLSLLLLLLLLL
jgi:hypothetical protein